MSSDAEAQPEQADSASAVESDSNPEEQKQVEDPPQSEEVAVEAQSEEVAVEAVESENNGDGGNEEDFEMLDLLCDAVEADDFKDSKKKELNMMTAIMDQR